MVMEPDPQELKDAETSEIIQWLVSRVTKSEEELREEKEEKKQKTTDLKLFLARKEGFELGTIEHRLAALAEDSSTHQYTQDFISDHGFTETKLNEETSLLEIRTPSYNREDHSILVEGEEYIRILTTERRYWTKKTIERVIDYLPGLSRLYLSADDIRDIVTGLNDITETRISGFTSKYQSYDDDRRISIQFHGGDENDIQDVKEEFNAKPTRVEFKQKNSPTDAVTGALTRNARINIPGVRAGSEELGEETLGSVARQFEEMDKEHYDIPNTPETTSAEGGLEIEGFTTLRLSDTGEHKKQALPDGGEQTDLTPESENGNEERAFVTGLKEQILDKKQRYEFTEWDEEDYLVLDKQRHETFQLGIEYQDLIVNARPGTTPITLKEFCRIILEEFKSTYSIETRTTDLVRE